MAPQGTPVGRWFNRWPADLVTLGSIGGGNRLNRKRGSVAYSLSLPTSHRLDTTEVLPKLVKVIVSHRIVLK